ncbi:MAG TPA: ABC transporter permease [Bacillota bacterium]|nr:ABC transporter permease [Bacillota bacterium]
MRGIMDSLVIAKRDLIRALRQRSQLYGALVRPLLWLFLLGTGLRNGFTGLPLGVNLQQYTFPGIMAMNILFSGVMSGASIIWDREFGFLKEVMIAPVSKEAIIGGKVLSGTMNATFQGLIVLALYPFLNLSLSLGQLGLIIMSVVIFALAATSVGVLLASKINSIEGFGTIQNFLVMPLFFLSGAMYPATNIPDWLRYLVYLNPFTYGVELLRGVVLNFTGDFFVNLAALILFILVIVMITIHFFHREDKGVMIKPVQIPPSLGKGSLFGRKTTKAVDTEAREKTGMAAPQPQGISQ